MLQDNFNRQLTYLRISITDRCNLRCRYCTDSKNFQLFTHQDIISFEEIFAVAKVATELGVNKIKITGGEPLVRRDVVKLIAMLASVEGITDLSMTTNGIVLAQYAKSLKDAGLMRINVSLDTTDPKRFATITNGGNINAVFAGIDAAITTGLVPLKLNCTISHSATEPDAQLVAAYAQEKNLAVRFIQLMNFTTGSFSLIEGSTGGNCNCCNRLRLLSNGDIVPCLFSDLKFNIRKLGIEEALLQAAKNKPQCGLPCSVKDMRTIGG